MTTRVAVYARYSSKNQNDVSIEDQFTMTDAYAAKQGWTITARFSDRARTGKNAHRPGLKQMFAELRTGAFDVVLVLSVDRLSRNLGDTLQFHDLFLFQRVELHTVLPEGKQDFLRLLVLGLAAQMTSSSTGEQTQKRIVNMLEKEGRITALPYGYRKLDTATGVNREPDPLTAPIVCRIFDEFASGMSAGAIIDRLNAEGIPSPQRSDWSRSTLRGNRTRNDGLLRNSTYAGRLVYNATSSVFEPGTGRRKVFETPEKRVEVFVPELQIVPDETYAAVQARLEETSQKVRSAGNASAAHRPRYLMNKLLVCAHCGRPYTIQAAGKYYCRNKARCGNRTPIARERIEARVFAALRSFLLSPELEARFDAILAAERRRLEGNDGKDELRDLRRRRTEAQTGLKGIMRAVEQGAPYGTFHDRAEQLSKEIEALDGQIDAIERARAAPRPTSSRALYSKVLDRMEQLLSDPEVLLDAHEHLATIIREVRLRPDPTAPDGMAAEILMDLGSLLSGAGYHGDFANRIAQDPQMTVGFWGSAPRRVHRRRAFDATGPRPRTAHGQARAFARLTSPASRPTAWGSRTNESPMSLAYGRPYLAIPGPSVIPDRVLNAMHVPAPNIYEGALEETVRGLVPDLRKVARTTADVAIYSCNGHGAWEAAASNMIRRGDKVLVLSTGRFAAGWGTVFERLGAVVETVDFGKRAPVALDRVEDALRADSAKAIKAVVVVHVDTATSVRNDIAGLRALMDAVGHPALLAVDCIASLAVDPFEMDAWGVDVMVAASQKGLMTPPGLGFVFLNEKARAASSDTASWYWDWTPRSRPAAFYEYFGGTAPTHHLLGLREALNMIAEEGGLEVVWARHAKLARAAWAAFEAWGQGGPLELNIADPDQRSHAVTALRIGGDNGTRLRRWVEEKAGVTLGIGLGMVEPDDPAWHGFFRVGHMGHLNAHMLLGALGVIEAGMVALDIPFGDGALAAAARVVAEA